MKREKKRREKMARRREAESVRPRDFMVTVRSVGVEIRMMVRDIDPRHAIDVALFRSRGLPGMTGRSTETVACYKDGRVAMSGRFPAPDAVEEYKAGSHFSCVGSKPLSARSKEMVRAVLAGCRQNSRIRAEIAKDREDRKRNAVKSGMPGDRFPGLGKGDGRL